MRYAYNPYSEGPEKDLEFAVGALSVPLALKSAPTQELHFSIR